MPVAGPGCVSQRLDRNAPAEDGVFSKIDDTHTPGTEAFNNSVVRESLTNHGRPGPLQSERKLKG